MRGLFTSIFLLIMFEPFVEPTVTVSVFDLNTKILEITRALIQTFNGVRRSDHPLDFLKERLFSNLTNIIPQIEEINMRNDTGK